MGVRAKFVVNTITRSMGSTYDPKTQKSHPQEMWTVKLFPVTGNGNEEDSKFWASTPSGTIELSMVNPAAAQMFADELGARTTGQIELYLPWATFADERPVAFGGPPRSQDVALRSPAQKAFELAASTHRAWERVAAGARPLAARNMHQVLGRDLASPCAMVVCWTEDGAGQKTVRGPRPKRRAPRAGQVWRSAWRRAAAFPCGTSRSTKIGTLRRRSWQPRTASPEQRKPQPRLNMPVLAARAAA